VGEKLIRANGVDLCAETFGDRSSPAVLLIMGATASMLWWPEGLCRRLAEAGRYVIRYDNRDTGRSTTYPPGQPGYSMDDLAEDAVCLLDAEGIDRAHLVGMSLGGMIAQIVSLNRPDRVASLSCLMSSIFGPPRSDLPPIDDRILAYHRSAIAVNWSDPGTVADYMVGGWALLSGSAHPFDETAIRRIATAEVARARNLLSMFNHARLKGGERWYGKINQIRVPTLVIHGTDDPVLPYEHGIALSKAIPQARLMTLQGTGHELHANDWTKIITAILEHSSTS
jgi:pimeloyl-ACP methyl ester carboxylesterase